MTPTQRDELLRLCDSKIAEWMQNEDEHDSELTLARVLKSLLTRPAAQGMTQSIQSRPSSERDTERLNWVLDCIGLDEPIPTRDWMDNNDARAAIDEAIAAQEGVTKP